MPTHEQLPWVGGDIRRHRRRLPGDSTILLRLKRSSRQSLRERLLHRSISFRHSPSLPSLTFGFGVCW
ncbi:hypothetical protein VTN77DRAFT_1704 [Rasamsonia byssochlamydoides]|uniref:uncharacterized protein n=1 Tax=Rasamsonia byssochlamydoides TaxID=89139 RepID=UPI003744186C